MEARMKATVVKNDSFDTVGLSVSLGEATVYQWGIAPSGLFFTKQVDAGKWGETVVRLIRLTERVKMLKRFKNDFMDTAMRNKLIREGQGVNLSEFDAEIERIEAEIGRTIDKVI